MQNIILILFLQLVYVPLLTLRTIFLVKNLPVFASIIGFFEMLIYVFGLSLVFSGDQSLLAMIVYALGFGLGLIVGTRIENKLAIGYVYVTINTNSRNNAFLEFIRAKGFAVTVYVGEGRDSQRYKYEILAKRNRVKELNEIISSYEPTAFVVTYEPNSFKGGFLLNRLK
ncbi:DUF2179 domain-containing protein [Lysinibacillus sp. LZ02]|uniref:DUF2179 domain-containing protein n=1 Tax=Lysinibacillus sp. LZ02 TaxID=3420668 RepID=UPI003D36B863